MYYSFTGYKCDKIMMQYSVLRMAQLPQGSKWSQMLNSLNEQEEAGDEKDEKGDSNVLNVTKEIDRDSSTSVNMSISSFGISLKWIDDLFGISPTTK